MLGIIDTARGVEDFLNLLKKRAESDVDEKVKRIIDDVKTDGDAALLKYGRLYDGADGLVRLGKADFEKAYLSVPNGLRRALNGAKLKIEKFHEKQLPKDFVMRSGGGFLGQLSRAVERVGIYVPGGTAAYPSSVLMNAVPAKLAGVKEIVMVTPPKRTGVSENILAAAHVAGVDYAYLIGGAQAVAALAYGTETIPKADKIVGPGNVYVAAAKKLIYGVCGIDMVAGPSEITIIADDSANPDFIAADLMSQAEHDTLASSVLITVSRELAEKTIASLERQIGALERKDIIRKSLKDYGACIVCDSLREAADIANAIAPEHLELAVREPEKLFADIKNAGSVFLGHYAPEPLGDYYAGLNHVLPTGGSARFFSPLSVDTFMKKIQYCMFDKPSFAKMAKPVICLAETEGLTAHANSIKVRLKK